MFQVIRRLVVGRPLASAEMDEQRLSKTIALAVFSSDALSSTAYATEEILFVTALGGASSLALGLSKLVPIAIVVAALLAIVIVSYRQVIFAYPNGGGAYVVSRENLGENASLVAGASLMVDYVLTVAVSISAGVAAIVSIPEFAGLRNHRVEVGLALIALITLLNMRGVKEAGRVFAVPTYVYMAVLGALIAYGLARSYFGHIAPVPYDAKLFEGARESGGTLGLFLLLKGFSSGAVALTGVEAISNGVPSFRRPESKNAAATLVWMGVLLGGLFFSVSVLAHRLHPYPSHNRTVIAQLGLAVFGNGPAFVILQFATAAILTLAANTAYAGFPGLSSIIAKDGYLPRQLARRGDRLAFSNGILMLAIAAGALLTAFGGLTNALIPLYAVGVFTSFTLSQSGMVRHHLRLREPGWRRNTVLNAAGAVATLLVLAIVAFTKFTSGAWVPIVVIPLIVVLFKAIRRHYTTVADALRVPIGYRAPRRRHTVVVLVRQVHAGVLEALAYARSISPDAVLAVSVVADGIDAERIEKQWAQHVIAVPLEIVVSSTHEFTDAALGYVEELKRRTENTIVTVLIPELFLEHWWQHLLHNQTVLILKGRLLFRKDVVVTSLPYRAD
ncbi:MAG: amino acid/polyamine/organocation transporter, superfamily [Actinomycetia bacterium]|nr:amino acid/polyamine/organocation transporter, superfamily [Actinomycetes bacterium]